MNCSLSKTYALIASAIAMLAVAVVLAWLFLNWIALLVAIGLAGAVSLAMIPAIRASIDAYVACRGPSKQCSIGSTIDVLGQAAALVSVAAWVAAVALEIPALAALASWFFAWLGISLAGIAGGLRVSGIVGAIACAVVLAGVATNAASYAACRDSETPGGGPIG